MQNEVEKQNNSSDIKIAANNVDSPKKTNPPNHQIPKKQQQTENQFALKKENQFAQVSQDMTELVYHLNSIQNDISELAGRPISLTKIED